MPKDAPKGHIGYASSFDASSDLLLAVVRLLRVVHGRRPRRWCVDRVAVSRWRPGRASLADVIHTIACFAGWRGTSGLCDHQSDLSHKATAKFWCSQVRIRFAHRNLHILHLQGHRPNASAEDTAADSSRPPRIHRNRHNQRCCLDC
jgi:hypothetical protein